MSNTAHIIAVLTAIVEDERAPAGERAAARRAIEVHQRKSRQPITPPASATSDDGFLFVHDTEVGTWCVFQGETLIGRWLGGATVEYHQQPDDLYLDGERWGYAKSWTWDPRITVTALIDSSVTIQCTWQELVSAEARIVIQHNCCVYLYTARAACIDYRAIVFDVIRQSPTFEQASRASAPLTARPIRAIQAG